MILTLTLLCAGSRVYLQNHCAVCVAGEEASVARLGGLEVGGDAHVSVAQRDLHVSVVVLHQGSARRTGEQRGSLVRKLAHFTHLFSVFWEAEWWNTLKYRQATARALISMVG